MQRPSGRFESKEGSEAEHAGPGGQQGLLTGPGEGHNGTGCVRAELKGARVDA